MKMYNLSMKTKTQIPKNILDSSLLTLELCSLMVCNLNILSI